MPLLLLTDDLAACEILVVGDTHHATTRTHTAHLKFSRRALCHTDTLADAAKLKRKFDNIILSAFSRNAQNSIYRSTRHNVKIFEKILILSDKMLRESGKVIYVIDDTIGQHYLQSLIVRIPRLIRAKFFVKRKYTEVDIDKLSALATKHGFSVEQIYSVIFDHTGNRYLERRGTKTPSLKHGHEALYVCLSKLGKQGSSSSLVERIMNDVNQTIENSGIKLNWTKMFTTGKEKTIIFAGSQNRRCVIKVPLSSMARQAETRQKHLRDCFRLQLKDLRAIIPESLGSGSVGDTDWYAESKVSGTPLIEIIDQSNRHAFIEEIGSVLKKLCPPDMSHSLKMQDDLYTSLIEAPLTHIEPVIWNNEQMHLVHKAFCKWFCGKHLDIGPLHGDFSVSNIFCTQGNISGLIDWEDANQQGISILDTINYLDSAQRACEPSNTIVDSLKLLALHAWPNADEMTLLKKLFQYHNLNIEQLSPIAALYSITHLSDQIRMFGSAPESRLANRCRNVVAFISSLPQ